MAIIKCPECGKEISDKAKECLGCGYPITVNCYMCEECKIMYDPMQKTCPQCGAPTPNKAILSCYIKEKKIYFIIAFILMLILVVLVSLSIFNKKNNDIVDAIDNVESFGTKESNDEQAIELLIEQFISDLNNGNLNETQNAFTEEFNYLDKCIYSLEDENTIKLMLEKTTFVQKNITVDTTVGKAIVVFDVTHPKYDLLLDAVIDNINIFSDNNKSTDKVFVERLNDAAFEYVTDNATVNLTKVNGEWKIINDSMLESFIFFGATAESSIQDITNNELKLAEREEYISQYMELSDFLVTECEGYLGTVPGIRNVSLKNNGNRAVNSVTLYLDFVDDLGASIVKKTIVVLGNSDNVLEGGYSWKMQNGSFFEIDNLPEGINLDKVNVGIEDISFDESYTSSVKSEEEKYIDEYLELLDYKVGICQSYAGKCPGISDISIKNNGTKSIAELRITVFFQDADGKDVAEDSFLVIGGWGNSDELKANYSWKMQSDRFYEIENLADEVDISRHRVEITEIVFN